MEKKDAHTEKSGPHSTLSASGEHHRAERIIFTIGECHEKLDGIYEGLVDRDYIAARQEAIALITEIKSILRSIDDDDF